MADYTIFVIDLRERIDDLEMIFELDFNLIEEGILVESYGVEMKGETNYSVLRSWNDARLDFSKPGR